MTVENHPVNQNHSLYLCYFGLYEPLVQTQVLTYLREIRKESNIRITLLTFETNPEKNWTKERVLAEKEKLLSEGIDWHFLKYHKTPSVPATALDILNGAYFSWRLIKKEGVNIIHGKVHVPTLMGAIAKKLSFKKPRLLFDIRGFFPEEYTDAGWWKKNGWLYKSSKQVEKWIIKESDGFVVLTEKARDILFPESRKEGIEKHNRPVEVIPCCVDFNRFEEMPPETRSIYREKLNLTNRYVITYVGSFGGWYMTDEMIDFFIAARKYNPNSYLMLLTQRDQQSIIEKLRQKGIPEKDFLVIGASPTEIPAYLSAADVALSFIEACYSKQASSPTKIAEYLAAGLPVVLNPGVGDLDELVDEDKVAVSVKNFTEEDYLQALKQADELRATLGFAEKCKESAKNRFDLSEVAGTRYRRLYRRLLQK